MDNAPPSQEPLTWVRGFFAASPTNPRQSRTVQDENSKSKFMEEIMGDFTIEDMLAIQQALQEKYKDKWEPLSLIHI